MKKTLIIFSLITILAGCSQKSHNEAPMSALAETAEEYSAENAISSSAAVETGKDSSRKFIRTADIRFKAKDVVKSTYIIEDIAARQGGFVSNSSLRSETERTENVDINKDSTLQLTRYTVIGDLTIRIPNVLLDTTLKEIARQIDFLDFRVIKATDVSLDILANNLTQNRLSKNEQRLTSAIDNRGKKLEETTSAEELLLRTQESADNAKISNLSLADQINFSTINLTIYQNSLLKKEMIGRSQAIEEYKTPFGQQCMEAFSTGWSILLTVIVAFINIWPFLLGIVLFFVAYKIYKKRRQS